MTKSEFKKIFSRFAKDNEIYYFIFKEIKKEYGNFDVFFYKVADNNAFRGIFNLRSVLSFSWEGKSLIEEEKDKSFEFWRNIHEKWLIRVKKLKLDY